LKINLFSESSYLLVSQLIAESVTCLLTNP